MVMCQLNLAQNIVVVFRVHYLKFLNRNNVQQSVLVEKKVFGTLPAKSRDL